MTGSIFTDAELDYLASATHGRLATQQPDGTLQVNPVGFRWNPDTGTIDIGGFGMAGTRKFRNVADNGRAAFVVDDITSTDPVPGRAERREESIRVRCLDLRGTAEAVSDPEDAVLGEGYDSAVIRFRPRRIIGMAVEDPDVEPHEIVANARDVAPA